MYGRPNGGGIEGGVQELISGYGRDSGRGQVHRPQMRRNKSRKRWPPKATLQISCFLAQHCQISEVWTQIVMWYQTGACCKNMVLKETATKGGIFGCCGGRGAVPQGKKWNSGFGLGGGLICKPLGQTWLPSSAMSLTLDCWSWPPDLTSRPPSLAFYWPRLAT